MSNEAAAKPWPFQGKIYWTGMLFSAVVVIFIGIVRRRAPDDPVYALFVVCWTWGFAPGVAAPGLRLLPRRWFRVPARERALHHMLGVGIFGRLLDVSGWNRHMAEPMRGFSRKRAGLPSLERSVRAATIAHGAGFAVHLLVAIVERLSAHPWAALWIVLSGLPTHFYPTLLQRSIMLRLQPVLDKLAAAENPGTSTQS